VEIEGALAEGARRYNAGRFWDAHEAWEEAWLALKAAGRTREADVLQGFILVSAAFENRARGRERGFKRQMAEGLARIRRGEAEARALGFDDVTRFTTALLDLYLDACRDVRWERWRARETPAPALARRASGGPS